MRERRLFGTGYSAVWVAPALLLLGCAESETGSDVADLFSGPAAILRTPGELAGRMLGPAATDPAPLGGGFGPDRERLSTARPNRTIDDMVEAPEFFADRRDVTWEGSETLGGIWIAHGAIDRAYRVRLTNLRTSVVVDGALLPRHGTPSSGPDVMVSADAADALGMLPGISATLDMVAIQPRQTALAERDYIGPEPVAQTDASETTADEAAGTVLEAPIAVAAGAPGATAEVGQRTEPVKTKTKVLPSGAGYEPAIDPPAPAAVDGPAPVTEQPRKEIEPPKTQIALANPEPVSPVETSPAAEAAPALPAPEVTLPPVVEVAPQPTDDVVPQPVVEAQPPVSGTIDDGKRFVQSGWLKTPELAADLVRTLSSYGVASENRTEVVQGETRNRVVAGPFTTHEARAKALELFRAIGVYGARSSTG